MEIWKDVPGYEGSYQVSDQGNVRSLDRVVRSNTGSKIAKGKILTPKIGRGGYLVVSFSIKSVAKFFLIHRLVLTAFVGPCPKGMEACHGDLGKTCNKLSNLRWDTRKNNHADKLRLQTQARGDKINTSKLTEADVLAMRAERACGTRVEDLSRKYGVSTVAVSKICVGDNWRHVGGPLVPRQRRVMTK